MSSKMQVPCRALQEQMRRLTGQQHMLNMRWKELIADHPEID
jgi:hypothetical protein